MAAVRLIATACLRRHGDVLRRAGSLAVNAAACTSGQPVTRRPAAAAANDDPAAQASVPSAAISSLFAGGSVGAEQPHIGAATAAAAPRHVRCGPTPIPATGCSVAKVSVAAHASHCHHQGEYVNVAFAFAFARRDSRV